MTYRVRLRIGVECRLKEWGTDAEGARAQFEQARQALQDSADHWLTLTQNGQIIDHHGAPR